MIKANDIESDECAQRTQDVFLEAQRNVHARADRLFAHLMLFQWAAGIAAALWISPKTWIGAQSQVHWHVWAAIFLGGGLAAFPALLAWKQPGEVLTRHIIAISQMLTSALLIHLTGGRIETHFHVFGSLAFFAFYRDWRVLMTATIVVAVDHMARGIFWPESVFGVLTPSPWRWTEHAAWVIFEDTFLIISIRQSLKDMLDASARRAKLELINVSIEGEVAARTSELTAAHKELQASEQRFRMLSASAPIGIFETDANGEGLYTNQYWQNIAAQTFDESLGTGWRRAVHPEDEPKALAAWKEAASHTQEFDAEFRLLTSTGQTRWVHMRSTPTRSKDGVVTGHIGTVEDITARKRSEAELEAAHVKLLEISRQAGMAEVATGVLHNVGNVLNSVNVSSTLVADRLKKSKVGTLTRIAAVVQENASSLDKFVSEGRGRQLPTLLSEMSDQLMTEQAANLNELESLRKNIEHIKDIVAMQQSYAKVSGVTEILPVEELVEDALRMNAGALAREDVEVVREFEKAQPISIDKHGVLQILVNLIRNAKHACEACAKAEVKKRITLRITNAPGTVRIAVADNGIGIPPENLTRVFEHGFTTKKDGHGFGLHSGALSAKDLGGSLIAESAGRNCGATFTLELPTTPRN